MLRLVYNTAYQLRAFKQYPELFYWFPDHVDPLRETYLEDLERDFDAGASGIKPLPIFHGFLRDHPGFMPVDEMCRERKKAVILDSSWWDFSHMPPYNEVRSRQTLLKRYADYARLMGEIFRAFPTVPFRRSDGLDRAGIGGHQAMCRDELWSSTCKPRS